MSPDTNQKGLAKSLLDLKEDILHPQKSAVERAIAYYEQFPSLQELPIELTQPLGAIRNEEGVTFSADGLAFSYKYTQATSNSIAQKLFNNIRQRYSQNISDYSIINNFSISDGVHSATITQPILFLPHPSVFQELHQNKELFIVGDLTQPLTIFGLFHELGHYQDTKPTFHSRDIYQKLQDDNEILFYDEAKTLLEIEERAWDHARETLAPVLSNQRSIFTEEHFSLVKAAAMKTYTERIYIKIRKNQVKERGGFYHVS